MSGTDNSVTFTLADDPETDGLLESAVESSSSICKFVYTRAAKGERPDISISGCTD